MFTSRHVIPFMANSISSTPERSAWLKDDRTDMTSRPYCSFLLWVGWGGGGLGKAGGGGGGMGWVSQDGLKTI
jgi:hypothetical protein